MKPTVSVIICTYNRCEMLKAALESFLRQELNGAFEPEVIVVDNNSKDATKAVVDSFQGRWKGSLKYILETKQGKPYAINAGIRSAQGDFIVFTDDDIQLDKQWLPRLMECFQTYNCDCVGGRVVPDYPENTPAWVKANPNQMAGMVVIYDYGEGVRKYDSGSMDLFIGANYAFKKSVFDECGLFRTDLVFGKIAVGEDHEFINRLLKKNKVLYYCGKAVVHHPVEARRMTLRHIARWHVAIGMFCGRMEREAKEYNFKYLFGVPQYIIKGIVQSFFSVVLNVFDRLAFLKHYRSFFRYIGMIREYRAITVGQRGL